MSAAVSTFGLFLPCPECGETHAGYVKSAYGVDRCWDCGRVEGWDSNGQRWVISKECQAHNARKEIQDALH
jgi:ribosomal protein S27E